MNNYNPLVSICIPTYNGEKFLLEALKSALNQTYSNIEIIVSDDASKDHTLQIVENFKAQCKIPIHIFRHKPKGIGANWNNCVKHSNGQYIKFLFQDDVFLPNCIERLVNISQSDDNVGLVYCKRHIIFDIGKRIDLRWFEDFKILHNRWNSLIINEGVLLGIDYLKDKYLLNPPKNKIGEPTAVLIRRTCFDRIGLFSEILDQALDIEFYYRLMPNFKIGFIDETLVKFRLHDNQASRVNAKKNVKVKENRILMKMLLKHAFWYLHPQVKLDVIKTILHYEKLEKFHRKVINRLKKISG